MQERAGASGPFILPRALRQSWDGQAPAAQELLAAGHEAGVYSVTAILMVRVTPVAGVVDRLISWTDSGAQLLSLPSFLQVNSGLTNAYSTDAAQIFSDGIGAIGVRFEPGGVVLPASFDLYFTLQRLTRN